MNMQVKSRQASATNFPSSEERHICTTSPFCLLVLAYPEELVSLGPMTENQINFQANFMIGFGLVLSLLFANTDKSK